MLGDQNLAKAFKSVIEDHIANYEPGVTATLKEYLLQACCTKATKGSSFKGNIVNKIHKQFSETERAPKRVEPSSNTFTVFFPGGARKTFVMDDPEKKLRPIIVF